LQAMGGVFDARWAHNGIVATGRYCTTQGIVQQIGELGVALITLLLAVYTFVAALWRVGLEARGVALGLVGLACVFIALWVGIGASIHKNYEVPTPYWCWINTHYQGDQLGGEYVWLWMALFASAILYPPLYFWTKGRLSVDNESWYKLRKSKPDPRVEYTQRRTALAMLVYPVAYSLIVLPTSVTRWMQFKHHHVSSAATFFGATMFSLSGAINVILFLIFKPRLLLFSRPEPEELGEPEIELVPQGSGSAIFTGTKEFQHSPNLTSTLVGEGVGLTRVNSKDSDV